MVGVRIIQKKMKKVDFSAESSQMSDEAEEVWRSLGCPQLPGSSQSAYGMLPTIKGSSLFASGQLLFKTEMSWATGPEAKPGT